MLPPTYCTCLEIVRLRDTRPTCWRRAADRDLTPVEPQAVVDDDGAYLSIPDRLVRLGEDVAAGCRAMTGPLGRRAVRRARAVRARAEPRTSMTLDGTNTWVLREPGAARSVVVDPGPEIVEHLDAVAAYAGDVAVVLLTHGHPDHSEAARTFAERVGCGVRALDPQHRLGDEGLGDGDVVDGRRARGARRRHARAHLRLAVASCCRPSGRC